MTETTANPWAIAFDHHVWATARVFEACRALSPEQLDAPVPGVYGPPMATLRHLVDADAWYLAAVTEGDFVEHDLTASSLDDLAAEMASHGAVWRDVTARSGDGSRVISQRSDNGWRTDAPLSLRFAQALLHGADHRSQLCTALTVCGCPVPDIDVWDYGMAHGLTVDVPPEG